MLCFSVLSRFHLISSSFDSQKSNLNKIIYRLIGIFFHFVLWKRAKFVLPPIQTVFSINGHSISHFTGPI